LSASVNVRAPEMIEAASVGGLYTGSDLFDLDAPDFECAAFRALEGIEFVRGAFGLNTEQSHFKLAFWTGE
jgi:hypothetical protein